MVAVHGTILRGTSKCSFNKLHSEFADKKAYDDYLEQRETYSTAFLSSCFNFTRQVHEVTRNFIIAVLNLLFGEQIAETEAKIAEYQRLNGESIARNRAAKVCSHLRSSAIRFHSLPVEVVELTLYILNGRAFERSTQGKQGVRPELVMQAGQQGSANAGATVAEAGTTPAAPATPQVAPAYTPSMAAGMAASSKLPVPCAQFTELPDGTIQMTHPGVLASADTPFRMVLYVSLTVLIESDWHQHISALSVLTPRQGLSGYISHSHTHTA